LNYVYVDRSETTGEVFYVGHGKLKRFLMSPRYTEGWKEIAEREGFNRKVVYSTESKEDAILHEMRLIVALKDQGAKLVNKSDGPGTLGIRQTNTNSIRAIVENNASKGKFGIHNPHHGRKRSDATRRNISDSVKGTMTESQRLSMVGIPKPKYISVDSGRIRTYQTFKVYYPEELPYLVQIS
jgi:hypothetical protein